MSASLVGSEMCIRDRIKATPDPIAILIDIKSAKSVENNNVNIIPIKKPKYTICLANNFPYDLFAKSVIKKAIG